jgi:hypothetical protein
MSHKSAQSTAVSTIGIDLGKNSFHLVGLECLEHLPANRSDVRSRSCAPG